MWIITHRKIFYIISTVLISVSVLSVLVWGINFGIDFTGGSILEINYTQSHQEKSTVSDLIEGRDLGDFSLRETGDSGYILRTKTITDEVKNNIVSDLGTLGTVEEIRFNTIGPTLGDELKTKSLVAILVVIISIIFFVAYAFRQVSKPVSSWKYGFVAIAAFLHDVLIPVGLFAVLGHFLGVEVDTLFVVAILVVLGYSINDTIVVFDRIRENLREYPEQKRIEQFENVVGKSLKQTITRSINTSLTTLVTLLAIYFIGGESTKYFALALIAGVIAGTYSSIFFAAPMLVTINQFQKKKRK